MIIANNGVIYNTLMGKFMGVIDSLGTIISAALFGLIYAALVKLLDLKLFKKETKIYSKRAFIEALLFGIIFAVWNELFFLFAPF